MLHLQQNATLNVARSTRWNLSSPFVRKTRGGGVFDLSDFEPLEFGLVSGCFGSALMTRTFFARTAGSWAFRDRSTSNSRIASSASSSSRSFRPSLVIMASSSWRSTIIRRFRLNLAWLRCTRAWCRPSPLSSSRGLAHDELTFNCVGQVVTVRSISTLRREGTSLAIRLQARLHL